MPRVRSVGMNGFIEGGAYKGEHGGADSHWYAGWWSYQKMSDIKNPPPSKLWVFVDEHPDSINDAACAVKMAEPTDTTAKIIDYPASFHNGASGLSYADGHSEIHRWRGSAIKPAVTGVTGATGQRLPWNVDAGDSVNDIIWWSEVTTVKK